MNQAKTLYEILIRRFLWGGMPVGEFCEEFIKRFKEEDDAFGDSVYQTLEDVFGCADSYTTDSVLLAENPSFYLNEQQLRDRVALAADRLNIVK